MYQATCDESPLRRTTSDDRINRIHGSKPLGSAIGNYQLPDRPAGASDDFGVAVAVDTDAFDRDDLWTYH